MGTVALKGQRMLTLTGETGEPIDLQEEKVYQLDMKKKEYKVVTFADLRKQMEDAMRKAKADTKDAAEPEAKGKGDPSAKEYEVDYTIKDTGQSKTVAGLPADEVLATVTVREKGKTLAQAGGMVLDTSLWMTPNAPGIKEIADFRMKYFQKVYGRAFRRPCAGHGAGHGHVPDDAGCDEAHAERVEEHEGHAARDRDALHGRGQRRAAGPGRGPEGGGEVGRSHQASAGSSAASVARWPRRRKSRRPTRPRDAPR